VGRWGVQQRGRRANKKAIVNAKVAAENGAKHRFCDPDEGERKQIKYIGNQELHLEIWMHDPNWNISNEEAQAKAWALAIGKYFERRERFWLQKIADIKDKKAVFVCGDAHVDTFGRILDAAGWKVHVAARGIGITDEDRQNVANGLQYLKEHPEVLDEEWFQESARGEQDGAQS
jgi:hypothetical protein